VTAIGYYKAHKVLSLRLVLYSWTACCTATNHKKRSMWQYLYCYHCHLPVYHSLRLAGAWCWIKSKTMIMRSGTKVSNFWVVQSSSVA